MKGRRCRRSSPPRDVAPVIHADLSSSGGLNAPRSIRRSRRSDRPRARPRRCHPRREAYARSRESARWSERTAARWKTGSRCPPAHDHARQRAPAVWDRGDHPELHGRARSARARSSGRLTRKKMAGFRLLRSRSTRSSLRARPSAGRIACSSGVRASCPSLPSARSRTRAIRVELVGSRAVGAAHGWPGFTVASAPRRDGRRARRWSSRGARPLTRGEDDARGERPVEQGSPVRLLRQRRDCSAKTFHPARAPLRRRRRASGAGGAGADAGGGSAATPSARVAAGLRIGFGFSAGAAMPAPPRHARGSTSSLTACAQLRDAEERRLSRALRACRRVFERLVELTERGDDRPSSRSR